LESNKLEYERLINLQRCNYELIAKEKEYWLPTIKPSLWIKRPMWVNLNLILIF
jgi:hypothetical protein